MDSLDQWLNRTHILSLFFSFLFFSCFNDWNLDKVSVLTHEGRHIIGTLAGFDSVTNLILEQAIERIYSVTDPVDIVPMGLIVIRGDNLYNLICVCNCEIFNFFFLFSEFWLGNWTRKKTKNWILKKLERCLFLVFQCNILKKKKLFHR
jgi:small nuclear ribonucleoprotein (snRNP)-like protein